MQNDSSPRVVLEARAYIVCYKPPGLHTAPAGASDTSATLVSWMFESYPELAEIQGRRQSEGGLLHRLDRETAGLVLFARTQAAFDTLMQAAADGLFEKHYRALCRHSEELPAGTARRLMEYDPASPTSRLTAPFAIVSRFRSYGPRGRRVVALPVEERTAKKATDVAYTTEVVAVTPLPGGRHFDFHVMLTRGFRHQVRVHLSSIGFPIKGDPLYAPAAHAPQSEPRLALTATELSFPDPGTGEKVTVSL